MGSAVIYCRISRDTEGVGLGVDRQRVDCLDYCKRRGLTVVDVVVDNDVSAYSGKPRRGYRKACNMLEDGTADVLVAWHPDRIHRSPRELEDFVDLVERTGAQVVTVTAGDLDLATPEGRLMARVVGAVARKESEDKSRRLRRKHDELAAAGKVSGGGPRPFGFDADRIRHRPAEVRQVREAARRVLAGESLYGIAEDWNARPVPTSTGAAWSTTSIKAMLTSPRIAGLRRHGDTFTEAVWKPVLDRGTWDAVCSTLASRSRKRTRAARNYLLTGGLARCGRCGAALVAAPRPYGRAVACLSGHGGCNGVSMKADPLEALVVDAVLLALDGVDLGRLSAASSGADVDRTELVQVDAQLADLADLWAGGELTRAEWTRARGRLRARRDDLAARVADRAAPSPLSAFGDGDALRRAWPGLSMTQRRTILGAVLESVVVAPAGRAGGRVDLERVDVRWRA